MIKMLFVINSASFFVSHRLAIAEISKKLGYEVYVAAAYEKDAVLEIKEAGLIFHEVSFSRKGKNLLVELRMILSLYLLFKEVKSDLVHLITIKPYLYGGIAARLASVSCVVSAVAGLGILFSSNDFKFKSKNGFYQIAFGHKNQKVIFQNKDDCALLSDWGVVSNEQSMMIRGSGEIKGAACLILYLWGVLMFQTWLEVQ